MVGPGPSRGRMRRNAVAVGLLATAVFGLSALAQAIAPPGGHVRRMVIERDSSQAIQPPAEALDEPQQVVVDVGPRTTALFHRADCAWVRTLTTTRTYTVDEARKRYFQPHCHCIHGEDKAPPCPHLASRSTTDSATSPVRASAPARVGTEPARAVPTAPKPKPAVTRCRATTKKGTQCLRDAQPGRTFCWQH
jgi:hypothetical protein